MIQEKFHLIHFCLQIRQILTANGPIKHSIYEATLLLQNKVLLFIRHIRSEKYEQTKDRSKLVPHVFPPSLNLSSVD